jgi:Ribose 5-phosphate isomerase A (phosphoriboisomerase A)
VGAGTHPRAGVAPELSFSGIWGGGQGSRRARERKRALEPVDRGAGRRSASANRVSGLNHFPSPGNDRGLRVQRCPVVALRVQRLARAVVSKHQEAGAPPSATRGHYILDAPNLPSIDPAGLADLATGLRAVPGVVEHGLVLDMADLVLLGHEDGRVERPERG